MTELIQALYYPWRCKGWLWRLLPLALWQLIPVIGQLMLMGYGQSVVYAICSQQSGLPRLRLRQSLIDGLRLGAVGVVYCFPAILMVLLTFSGDNTTAAETTGGGLPIAFTAIVLIYSRISREIIKRKPAFKPILSTVNRLLTLVFVVVVATRLYGLFTTLQAGIQFSAIQLDSSDITLLFVASLLFIFVVIALLISGARFAVTGSSLLKPTATLTLMAANRDASIHLIVCVLLLAVGTLAATLVGAVFALIPGLIVMVAGNLSIWCLVARYVIKTGAVGSSSQSREGV